MRSEHTDSPSDAPGEDRRFVLAAFFDGDPTEGGGYVHKRSTLNVLSRLQDPEVGVVVVCGDHNSLDMVREAGLHGVLQRRTPVVRALGLLSSFEATKILFGGRWGVRLSPVDRLLRRVGADLVFFPSPDSRALQLYGVGYVFSVWDLCHLEHPDFPEAAYGGEFERRERLFGGSLRRAVAVIADSEYGRRLIAQAYGVPIDRVHAAPFLIAPQIRSFQPDESIAAAIKALYGLNDPYIFYPAQFWFHKNHRYIVAALERMLARYGWAPQAVFCGSDKGALAHTMNYARTLGIERLINYCGFVPEEHLPYLYRAAMALVMPTYFGPTNMPPLEALALGVPVCYSDFPSFREQFTDRVHYVDLSRPESLAEALQAIHTREKLPSSDKGRNHAVGGLSDEDRYLAVLRRVIATHRQKVAPPLPSGG